MVIFLGCGSSKSTSNNSVNGSYQEDSSNMREQESQMEGKSVKYETVRSIRDLIQSRGDELSYIVVGDSTRSVEDSPRYFETFSKNLARYGVTSYLVADSGHKLSEFISEDQAPTYHDVIEKIPGSGANTIVDISLAINDLWDYEDADEQREVVQNRLKQDLKKAIKLIESKKPDTIFIFTSPNPILNNDSYTSIYMDVYKELSDEQDIPFIDFYDNVYKDLSESEKSSLYRMRDGRRDHIHYGEKGQLMMVDYVSRELGLI